MYTFHYLLYVLLYAVESFENKLNFFAELRVGSCWAHETEPVMDPGRTVSWTLDLSGAVSRRDVVQGLVTIRVHSTDEHGTKEIIGMAVISNGLELLANENNWVTIEGQLFGDDDGSSVVGIYVIIMKFRPTVAL